MRVSACCPAHSVGKRGRGRTGKVSLALFEAQEAAKEVGDAGGEARDEDKADRDDVQVGELFGREREGDLVEEEAGREEGRVDCEW